MAELTVSIPPAPQSWVDHRLAEARYAGAAEYLRDLLRRGQWGSERAWLRAMIDEGGASGIEGESDDMVEQIVAEQDG